MTESVELTARVADAISEAVSPDGQLVTAWVAVIEVIDLDGSKSLHRVWSEDISEWLYEGMLRHALALSNSTPEEEM